MKIKLKTRAAGPDGVYGIGAVIDVPDKQAKQLVADGYATALEPFPAKAKTAEPIEKPAPVKPKAARK